MNKFDLFDALGGVDEDLLERSERKAPKRLSLRKAFIAAAAVMLLAVTAVAAPVLMELLFATDTEQTVYGTTLTTLDGTELHYNDIHMIHFDVENPGELPTTIEEYYIPQYAEKNGWAFDGGYHYSYDFGESTNIRWVNEGAPWQWVEFEQASFYQFAEEVEQAPGTNQFYIAVPSGSEVSQITISTSHGDIPAYRAKSHPLAELNHDENDHIHVFWSNGSYAFHVITSAGTDPEMLAQVIESVEPVVDPTPYLVDNGRIEFMESPPLENHLTLTDLPDGFTLVECEVLEDRATWFWENTDGDTISLAQRTDDQLDIDIHNYILEQREHALTEMDLNGTTVYFITAQDHVRALWKGNSCEFDVLWQTEEDVTWEQMAELIRSLEPVDDIFEYATE